jgi:hypothetical protein
MVFACAHISLVYIGKVCEDDDNVKTTIIMLKIMENRIISAEKENQSTISQVLDMVKDIQRTQAEQASSVPEA